MVSKMGWRQCENAAMDHSIARRGSRALSWVMSSDGIKRMVGISVNGTVCKPQGVEDTSEGFGNSAADACTGSACSDLYPDSSGHSFGMVLTQRLTTPSLLVGN